MADFRTRYGRFENLPWWVIGLFFLLALFLFILLMWMLIRFVIGLFVPNREPISTPQPPPPIVDEQPAPPTTNNRDTWTETFDWKQWSDNDDWDESYDWKSEAAVNDWDETADWKYCYVTTEAVAPTPSKGKSDVVQAYYTTTNSTAEGKSDYVPEPETVPENGKTLVRKKVPCPADWDEWHDWKVASNRNDWDESANWKAASNKADWDETYDWRYHSYKKDWDETADWKSNANQKDWDETANWKTTTNDWDENANWKKTVDDWDENYDWKAESPAKDWDEYYDWKKVSPPKKHYHKKKYAGPYTYYKPAPSHKPPPQKSYNLHKPKSKPTSPGYTSKIDCSDYFYYDGHDTRDNPTYERLYCEAVYGKPKTHITRTLKSKLYPKPGTIYIFEEYVQYMDRNTLKGVYIITDDGVISSEEYFRRQDRWWWPFD